MQPSNPSVARAFFGAGALAPIWQMTQSEFEASAICAAVDVVMERGRLQLEPTDASSRRALDRLQDVAARHAPAHIADSQAWATSGVQRLLAGVFQDDVLVGELPGIAHVVLVKSSQVGALSLFEVLRRVHMRQVEDALASGLPVRSDIRDEYLDCMERMHVLAPSSAHETIH